MADKVSSYAYNHDKLLRQYRRFSLYGCWAAALNFVALFISGTTAANGGEDSFGFGALFNHVGLLMNFLQGRYGYNIAIYLLIALAISIPATAALIFLGFKSYQGSKKCLYASAIVYGIDTIGLIAVFFSYPAIDGILAILVHLVCLGALVMGIYKRYALVNLQKTHADSYEPDLASAPSETTVMSFNETKRKGIAKKTVASKLKDNDQKDRDNIE